MFNWLLFTVLVLICLPGLFIGMPRLISSLQSTIAANLKPGQKLPPYAILVGVGIVQNVIIVAIAAAVGVVTRAHTGLDAPILNAFLSGKIPLDMMKTAVLATILSVTVATFLFLVFYYRFLRPRLDKQTVQGMESLRLNLGVWSRLLYGGIVEEVIVRWGLMSLLVWLGTLLAKSPTPMVIWIAIMLTGILFGLGHLPSHFAAGCQKTPLFIGSVIGSNLWLSLTFGWLFWQYGLLAAILGHMLFHLIWLPFENNQYMS